MKRVKKFFSSFVVYMKNPANRALQVLIFLFGFLRVYGQKKYPFLKQALFEIPLGEFDIEYSIGDTLEMVIIIIIVQQIKFRKLKINFKKEQEKSLEMEKSLIEERDEKEELIQSLEAAKRIQKGILPNIQQLQRALLEVQLYYMPKDIIGGDFYWYKEVGEYNFIAIADCTGHGTSGALLSVMCSNFLTKTVEEDGLVDTNEILNKCRDSLVGSWSESTETIRDGMDISLLRVHRATREMQWSGANSSLWLITGDEVTQFKGNKQAIARAEDYQLFDAQEILCSPGSLLFMSTDGLFDQFGGAEDRKLGRKRVIQELTAKTTLQEKKESLVQLFSSWKFQTEQTDDVCFLLMSVV